MKTFMIILGLLISSVVKINAQTAVTDPSYSVHNYKHPNKAAYAKKHNLDKLQSFDYIAEEQNQTQLAANSSRDYKHNVAKGKQTGGIAPTQHIDKNDNGFFSKRNYKHQF